MMAAMLLPTAAFAGRRVNFLKYVHIPRDIDDPMMIVVLVAGGCLLLALLLKTAGRFLKHGSALSQVLARLRVIASVACLLSIGIFLYDGITNAQPGSDDHVAASNVTYTSPNAGGAKFVTVGQ